MSWRGSAHIVFANWLNYCVYQNTPFNINDIRNDKRGIIMKYFEEVKCIRLANNKLKITWEEPKNSIVKIYFRK